MSNNPRVSIIIPIYNVEEYIDDCLYSVLNQTYSNIEILCIDDCGKDDSMNHVEKMAENDERFKILVHSHNRGQAAARNTGLEAASGKYVFFLDSDDVIIKNTIERMVLLSEEYSLDAIRATMINFEGEIPSTFFENTKDSGEEAIIQSGRNLFCMFEQNNHLYGEACGVLYLKDFLVQNEIFFKEGIIYEDNVFSFKVYMRSQKMMFLKESLYYYRQRKGSTMNGGCKFDVMMQSEMVLLSELFYEWKKCEGDTCLDRQVGHYFTREFKCLKGLIRRGNNLDLCELKYAPETLLYNLLFHYDKQMAYAQLNDNMIQSIKNYNKIYVYGAGRAAEEIIFSLKKNKLKVDSIIVTHKSNENSFMGIEIIEVIELKNKIDDDTVVILGTTSKYHAELKEELLKLGVSNIIEPIDI